jgi:hypothetical protein
MNTTAAQLPADVETLMRGLRLPHARAIAADVLATARAQRWDPTEVIKALLTEETAGRARSMLAARRKAAGFPTGKTFDVWDPAASSIPLPTQQALQTLEWVGRRENLVVCGPAGTGKTFFLEALGQKVIEAGMPVAWFTLEQIGVLVRAHRADDSLGKAVAKIVRAELVVIDLCRPREYADIERSGVRFVSGTAVLGYGSRFVFGMFSECFEECDEAVGRSISARLRRCRGEPGEGAFFDGQVGVEVGVRRSGVGVAQPQRDDSGVYAGVQQRHGAGVP